jgi:hypothetical protein
MRLRALVVATGFLVLGLPQAYGQSTNEQVTITQYDQNQTAAVTQTSGTNDQVVIEQHNDGNTTSVTQTNTNGEYANIYQDGITNSATVSETAAESDHHPSRRRREHGLYLATREFEYRCCESNGRKPRYRCDPANR